MPHTNLRMIYFLLLSLTSVYSYAQTCKDYIPNEWPDSRYINHGDGTITDNVTKLMWKQCPEGLSGSDCATGSASTYTWQDALALSGSSFAGYTDWRLPNIKELSSLASLNCYSPSINTTMFPNTPNASFWSSSPYANNTSYAWRLIFSDGFGSGNYRNFSYRVRLVRHNP